ncbi:MAG: sigma-70 family RNA polymerase sigma factor [Candidatus Paceibacterota bacterium]|jgi:RNA polymerase sigma-70 factor (ECF subfamily)
MKEEEKIKGLINKAKNGDSHAFAKVYEQYFTPIYRFIFFKVGNREEAEDLTQMVFLKALKSLDGFHFRDKPFSSWLYRIANNIVIDFFRKKKSLPMLDNDPDDWQIEFIDQALNPAEEAEEMELAHLARQAITKMKEPDRQILVMHYIEGLSYRDIAEIIDKNEAAVRQISSRSIQTLKSFFKDKGLL